MSSGIVRVKRTPGDFFQAYKPTFQNENLSFAARGLLAYLCTKPDDWEARNYDLEQASPGGKAALQTILKELREAGHIRRVAKKNKAGSFIGWETEVYECPEDNPDFPPDIPISGKTGNPKDRKPERPETGERKELIMSPTNNESLSKEENQPQKQKPKNQQQKPTPADIEYYNPLAQELLAVCSLAVPLVNGTKLDFTGVIKFLQANHATPDMVREFGRWYEKTPNLKGITENWKLFVDGKQPRHKQFNNGNGAYKNGKQNRGKQGNNGIDGQELSGRQNAINAKLESRTVR